MPTATEAGVSFRMSDGGDAIEFFGDLESAEASREADLRTVIEEHHAEVIDATMYRGVDYTGAPFAPYSENGPYYYNPAGAGASGKQQKAAVDRLYKKTSLVNERFESVGKAELASGGQPSRTGRTIKFASYGDFKRSLGRAVVDLTGPRAPHMLMSLVVQMFGPNEGALGIYNEPFASRAEGHNNGTGHLPRRRFLDITAERAQKMASRLGDLAEARIARISSRAR